MLDVELTSSLDCYSFLSLGFSGQVTERDFFSFDLPSSRGPGDWGSPQADIYFRRAAALVTSRLQAYPAWVPHCACSAVLGGLLQFPRAQLAILSHSNSPSPSSLSCFSVFLSIYFPLVTVIHRAAYCKTNLGVVSWISWMKRQTNKA